MQKKKGVSLIVLVITIIVMIVLAAAVVISLNNSGIIEKANTAVKAYNEDEVKHIASLAWSEAYLDGARTVSELTAGVRTGLTNAGLNPDDYGMIVTTTGVTISKGWLQDGVNITKGNVTLEAGDLIQYDSGVSTYRGKWKVLGAEDGNLLIMSTSDVGYLQPYSTNGGQNPNDPYSSPSEYGLINGITRMNDLSKTYATGTGAVTGRTIMLNDIMKLIGEDTIYPTANYNKKYTYAWNQTTTGKVDGTDYNGNTRTSSTTYTNGFTYFNSNYEEVVVDIGDPLPDIVNTLYYYSSEYVASLSTTMPKVSDMIFNNASYWLGDFVTSAVQTYVSYGWFCILGGSGYGSMNFNNIVNADGPEDMVPGFNIRAVVELSPNIQIGTKDATNGWSYSV